MYFWDLEQFSTAFEIFASETLDASFEQIKETADDWLLEKQSVYRGELYIEKLERNYFYLEKGAWGIKQASKTPIAA